MESLCAETYDFSKASSKQRDLVRDGFGASGHGAYLEDHGT